MSLGRVLATMAALVQINNAAQAPLLTSSGLSTLFSFATSPKSPPVTREVSESHNDLSVFIEVPQSGHEPQQPLNAPARHSHCKPALAPSDPLEPNTCSAGPMSKSHRVLQAAAATILGYFSFSNVQKSLDPNSSWIGDERADELRWVASSHSWLDRKACNWLGICDTAHLRTIKSEVKASRKGDKSPQTVLDDIASGKQNKNPSAWNEEKTNPEDWSDDERRMREIPQYVLDYAPLVHLYSGEQFWPCDIADHLIHTTPYLNYTPLQARSQHPKLTDLNELNQYDGGRFIFLQSDDNVEDRPEWLGGEKNIPSTPSDDEGDDGDYQKAVDWNEWSDAVKSRIPHDLSSEHESCYEVGEGHARHKEDKKPSPVAKNIRPHPSPARGECSSGNSYQQRAPRMWQTRKGGRSDAPAVLVMINKGEGIIDAFWFYFYSYNLGNVVLNVRFGNHVGDWEHSLVRFEHGVPKAVFFSEHSGGEAYSYEAVEKLGKRPVIYSATGTHAMYATPGVHEYVLPLGLLHDVTDRGPLWDPLLNAHAYTYDYLSDNLRSSNVTPHAPTQWFYYNGHWGDKFYPLSDPRQYRFAGQYHYVNGPLGPRFKNLDRKAVCQSEGPCVIKNWIDGRTRARRWVSMGEGEEMSENDVKRFLGVKENAVEDK